MGIGFDERKAELRAIKYSAELDRQDSLAQQRRRGLRLRGRNQTMLSAPNQRVLREGDVYLELDRSESDLMQPYRITKIKKTNFHFENENGEFIMEYHNSTGAFLRFGGGVPVTVAVSDKYLER